MLTEIIETLNKLNEIDEYIHSLSERLSTQDSKLSDLYHVLESNNLNASQSCKFVKEMQLVCKERRIIKNDLAISNTYKNHINKLINLDNRKLLITELNKRNKTLQGEYKNRIYTNDELVEKGIRKEEKEG